MQVSACRYQKKIAPFYTGNGAWPKTSNPENMGMCHPHRVAGHPLRHVLTHSLFPFLVSPSPSLRLPAASLFENHSLGGSRHQNFVFAVPSDCPRQHLTRAKRSASAAVSHRTRANILIRELILCSCTTWHSVSFPCLTKSSTLCLWSTRATSCMPQMYVSICMHICTCVRCPCPSIMSMIELCTHPKHGTHASPESSNTSTTRALEHQSYCARTQDVVGT